MEDLKAGEKQVSAVKLARVNVVVCLVQLHVLFSCLSISSSPVRSSYTSNVTSGTEQKESYN